MKITTSVEAVAKDVSELYEGDLFVTYDGEEPVLVCDYASTIHGFTHVVYHPQGESEQNTFAWRSDRMVYVIDLK